MAADVRTSQGKGLDTGRLADLIIETLKDFTARGQELTSANLSRALAERPELAVLTESAPAVPGDLGVSDRELSELKERLERVTEQKDAALRHLHQAEEAASEREDFFQRALLTMIRLIHAQGDAALEAALGELKKALIDEAGLDDLEAAVQRVKNEILKAGRDPTEAKPAGRLSRLFAKGKPAERAETQAAEWLDKLRLAYLNLLAELDLDLGPAYLKDLAALRRKVARAEDVDYLLSLRPEIEAVVRLYASLVMGERNRAASFIAQVAQRLADIEAHLVASAGLSRDFKAANDAFNADLAGQIGRMSVSVRDSQGLEELKSLVLDRLATVGQAIEKKRREDEARLAQADQELSAMRRQFDRVRHEVDRVQKENEDLSHKLQLDPLTGAFNRRAYEERLAAEWDRFKRYRRVYSVVMLDVDHFKKVNDTYGHQVGDACLREIVNRIKPVLRRNDLLARYGGEEFVVLLPEVEAAQGREVAEKIRREIDLTEFMVRGKGLPVTISLGVSQVRPDDAGRNDVVDRADRALYAAKEGGRNRVEVG